MTGPGGGDGQRRTCGRSRGASCGAGRRNAIPDVELQRLRDQQQRKLESDLKAGQARLARAQQNELRSRPAGPGADEIRKQHAAEQQAFEAHAVQQRHVLTQRMQKQIVNPGKVKPAAKSNGKDKGQDKRRE